MWAHTVLREIGDLYWPLQIPKSYQTKQPWYLATNLPHPDSDLAIENELAAADLSEIVRLYGLRM